MGSPILLYSPGGGTPGSLPQPPPLPGTGITNAGLTQLVNGQSYIDVVFDHIQTDNTWIFVECSVLNLTDASPLNIWPGITTSKTTAGFRLQLNGLPDSNNYFLDWAISGINIAPTPATTFVLTGPTSGNVGTPYTFTVHLPSSTTGTATITPSDAGGGGAFSPATVTLTTGLPSTAFTYTPGSAGTKIISVTNNGGLLNPASITFTATTLATGYSMTGPSSGTVGVASTNFTVTLTPAGYTVPGPVTVTPHEAGTGTAGTFTPTTVNLTTGSPSATFTFTPGSTGAKTISATNSGGLTDPANLTYTSNAALPHLLNTLISYWKLDEATGATRNDSQGTNNLTFGAGGVAGHPTGVAGKINNGALFDSSNGSSLTVASNSSLQVTSDFTISTWVKLTSQGAGISIVVGKTSGGTTDDYTIGYEPTLGLYMLVGALAVGTDIANTTPLSNGVWYHVVGWFDHLTGQVYLRVNDATTYQSTTSPALVQTTQGFCIGGNPAGTAVFQDGLIDEVGFWKRKLTAGEITALYNGGAGLPFSSFTL
jgi:hypothetical protein